METANIESFRLFRNLVNREKHRSLHWCAVYELDILAKYVTKFSKPQNTKSLFLKFTDIPRTIRPNQFTAVE